MQFLTFIAFFGIPCSLKLFAELFARSRPSWHTNSEALLYSIISGVAKFLPDSPRSWTVAGLAFIPNLALFSSSLFSLAFSIIIGIAQIFDIAILTGIFTVTLLLTGSLRRSVAFLAYDMVNISAGSSLLIAAPFLPILPFAVPREAINMLLAFAFIWQFWNARSFSYYLTIDDFISNISTLLDIFAVRVYFAFS